MSRLLQAKIISVLSMTSLIATAYTLIFIPNTRPASSKKASSRRQVATEPGPVHQYIGYLNGGLSLLIGLNAISFKDKGGVHEGFWLLCFLPVGEHFGTLEGVCPADILPVSFSIIMLARRLMLSVDVHELEDLKYGYKGA